MSYFSDIRAERNGSEGGYFIGVVDEMALYLRNHVVEGGVVTDGGSATDDDVSLDVDMDVTAAKVVIGGVYGAVAAVTDTNHQFADASTDSILNATTPDVYCTIVVSKSAADVFAVDVVAGTPAASGAAVPPTTAAIDAVVGHEDWIILATALFVRTAANTLDTVVVDNTARPVFNVAIDRL